MISTGLREYQPGDPLTRMVWKRMRTDTPPVGVFVSEEKAELHLRYADIAHLSDPERRLSQLCRWVLDAQQAGLRYALSLPGRELPAGTDEAHLLRCLQALALHQLPRPARDV